MVTKNNLTLGTAPLSVIRGEQVSATYTGQLIPEYQDNPLIMSQPPIWTRKEVEEKLSHFPHYSSDQRNLPDEIRLHLLENCREFYVPQANHYEIHLIISNMIRRGYIGRNPATKTAWADGNKKFDDFVTSRRGRRFLRSKARGSCIIGMGGVGKSTAVENILYNYPQVINHTVFKGHDLILRQIVWLKLQCPDNGSLRELCLNFIDEVDDILKPEIPYAIKYGVNGKTKDQLLRVMARIASNHYLGLVIFDEIQDLSDAKGGGAISMLNFFVKLEDILGIPFMLIGTPKADRLFLGEFRQCRRVSEQGDLVWKPMRETDKESAKKNMKIVAPEWNTFVRAMWKYWYLSNEHVLPTDLLEDSAVRELYKQSKGITALVVTIFYLSQRHAILTDVEDVTQKVIQSAVRKNQNVVNAAFERIKAGEQRKKGDTQVTDINNSHWRVSQAEGQAAKPSDTNSSKKENPPLSNQAPAPLGRPASKSASKRAGGVSSSNKHERATTDPDDFRNINVEGKEDENLPATSGSPFVSQDEFQ